MALPYNNGPDSEWLQNVLAQSQNSTALSSQQLFRPGAFDNLSSTLERSRHLAPLEGNAAAYESPMPSGFGSDQYAPQHSWHDTLSAEDQTLHYYGGDESVSDARQQLGRGEFIGPLDEEAAFGSETIKSILVCGPPGAGKTATIKNILYRYSIRMDGIVVATKTEETIPWLEGGIPRQYIYNDADPEMFMALLDLFSKYYERTQRKIIWCVVIDDILMGDDDKRINAKGWLEEYIKRAHRAGILLIIGCHNATDVQRGSYKSIAIKMQLGLADAYPEHIRQFWELFGKTHWPYYQDFVNVYSQCVTGNGQCLVLQNVVGPNAVSYWRPEEMKLPIVFGHRDWWLATYMWTDPVRFYTVETDRDGNVETRWPYCGPNNTAQQSGPSLDLLKKQQSGVDIEKELSKLISIEPPSSTGGKKSGGRAKRTSAIRKGF